jgi:predicted RNA-binding protein with PIN domain
MQAESILLEPQYSFRLEVPTENVGRAMTDIQNMGGEFSSPHTSGNTSIITGTAPVSQMQDYMKEVTAYTAGNGKLFCNVSGYAPCHNSDEVIRNIAYNPESDTDNPCGSVFCAHGAGFTVKWDEVKDYMHLEGVLEKKSYSPQDASERISNYVSSVVNDEELLRIFEKTYGPVKVKNYNAVTPRRVLPQQKVRTKKPIERSSMQYLLVDGYNIIFAWEELKKAAEQSLDLARELLIQKLCNYRGYTGVELILVFDAYKVKGNLGEVEKVHNISVVYTKEAETADAYIEKVTHELAKKHHVRVATSDNLEQLIILGNGAIRVSASAFEKEVNDAENEIRRFINQTF